MKISAGDGIHKHHEFLLKKATSEKPEGERSRSNIAGAIGWALIRKSYNILFVTILSQLCIAILYWCF
jgi:hypothetical protein